MARRYATQHDMAELVQMISKEGIAQDTANALELAIILRSDDNKLQYATEALNGYYR